MILLKMNSRFLKSAVVLFLAFAMVFVFAGCKDKGEEKQPASSVYLTPEEASKYVVTLGNYSGIEVDLSKAENAQMYQSALNACTPLQIKDRAVAEGDTINLNYTGKFESTGEAFEGGSATGAWLTIGSGKFIPGFEEGLIGAKPNEAIDLYLTFPKDYGNEKLAGAKVIFSVLINYIKEYSAEDIKSAKESVVIGSVMNLALEGTTFTEELPNAFIDSKVNLLVSEIEATAATVSMSTEEYLSSYFQMTVDQMKAQALEYATSEAKTEIMFLAIAHKEGISLSEEEYTAEIARLAAEYNYKDDVAGFVEAYGGEEDVRNAVLLMKISEHIGTLNTIKE